MPKSDKDHTARSQMSARGCVVGWKVRASRRGHGDRLETFKHRNVGSDPRGARVMHVRASIEA